MTRHTLEICIDNTLTPPPLSPSLTRAGERFFAIFSTFLFVASGQLERRSSRRRHPLVSREEFLSRGLEIFGPRIFLSADLITPEDELAMSRFAEEAVSRDDGAAVVPVQITLTIHRDNGISNESRTVPASESSVEALPEVVAVDENKDSQGQCSICLEDLFHVDHDHTVAKMPCSHLFRRECIIIWLKKSHFCPLCRTLCLLPHRIGNYHSNCMRKY